MANFRQLIEDADTEEKLCKLFEMPEFSEKRGWDIAGASLRLAFFMVARHDREIKELRQEILNLSGRTYG